MKYCINFCLVLLLLTLSNTMFAQTYSSSPALNTYGSCPTYNYTTSSCGYAYLGNGVQRGKLTSISGSTGTFTGSKCAGGTYSSGSVAYLKQSTSSSVANLICGTVVAQMNVGGLSSFNLTYNLGSTSGTKYYVIVVLSGSDGTRYYSNSISVTTTVAAPPATPTGLAIVPTSPTTATASCNAVSGATSYEWVNCSNNVLIGTTSSPTLPMSNLTPNAYVSVKVRAKNSSNLYSAYTICMGTTTPPAMPDLRISSQSLSSTSVMVGTNITVTSTIVNSGSATSGSTTERVFLHSTLPFNAATATAVNNETVTSIAPNGSIVKTVTASIPTTMPTGTGYLTVVVDYPNYVGESNENNNTFTSTLNVTGLPDLVPQAPTLSATSVFAGGQITYSTVAKNMGTAVCASSTYRIVLSDNTTFDASDLVLKTGIVPSLAVNAQYNIGETFTMPTGVSGTKYLIIFLDAWSVVAEANEMNNLYVSNINILAQPDLLVQSATIPSTTIAPTESIAITAVVANSGLASAGSSIVKAYFTPDGNYNSTTPAASAIVTSLSTGANQTKTINLAVPAGTVDGTYPIVIVADAPNVITESNEGNNSYTIPITIVTPQPLPTADFAADATTIVEGGTIVFDGSLSANAQDYTWSFEGGQPNTATGIQPSITYLAAGVYSVTLTVSNGAGTDSEIKTAYITVTANTPTLPTANFTANATTICATDFVSFTNSSQNATSYIWLFAGATPDFSMDTNPTVQYLVPGVYDVTLFASNANGDNELVLQGYITVNSCGNKTSVIQKLSSLHLSPNPTTTETTLHYSLAETANTQIKVYDITGQLQQQYTIGQESEGEHTYTLSTAALPKGMYVVQLQTDKDVPQTVKLIRK